MPSPSSRMSRGQASSLLLVVGATAACTGLALFLWSNSLLLRHRRRRLRRDDHDAATPPTPTTALAVVHKQDLARQGLVRVPREVLMLRQLRELNLMGNALVELPEEIGGLTQLVRLGLKDNALEALPESIGNLSNLVELYLTNNRLSALPASMGRLTKLRKLQASFNRLQTLPLSMRQMAALELFRAACNADLEAVPPHLAQASALTWLSFGGSRFCNSRNALDDHSPIPTPRSPTALPPSSPAWWRQGPLPVISLAELEKGEKLGDGASGDVFRARWLTGGGREVALKLFRGDTGPDGRCVDELEVLCLVDHPALTKVRAVVVTGEEADAHKPAGVIMDLVAGSPLAEKPNASSVLRCRWEDGKTYPLPFILSVGSKLAGALQHLHALGVMHGDVYAHNVVATADGASATLLDYGASFLYEKGADNGGAGAGGGVAVDFERLEVRALGLLLADLLARCPDDDDDGSSGAAAAAVKALVERCLSPQVAARPSFAEVGMALDKAAREGGAGWGSPRMVIPAE